MRISPKQNSRVLPSLKPRYCGWGQLRSHLYSNERLEFLGDAVLGFVVAEHLYRHFPEETEGFLTQLRAKLVNGLALADYAESISLGAFILMSENMVQTEGRQNQTILADAFEAVIGALYLDRASARYRRYQPRQSFHRPSHMLCAMPRRMPRHAAMVLMAAPDN